MRLIIEKSAQNLGLMGAVACKVSDITVQTEHNGALDDDIRDLISELELTEGNLSKPEVHGFRDLFSRLGYPAITPAGERLVNGFVKNGFKRFNNIVDAYNIVSANYTCGLGMHDLGCIHDDVTVKRARGGETVVPMFKSSPVVVRPGDLIYTTDNKILAWLGYKDVDSDDYKVTSSTTSLLLVALGNERTDAKHNKAVCDAVVTAIRKTCPSAGAVFLDTCLARGCRT